MPRAQLCLDTDLRNFCLVLSSCAWWVLLRYHGRGQVLGAAGALNLFYQGLPPYTSLLPTQGEGGSRVCPNEKQVAPSCAFFFTWLCLCFLSLFAGLSALLHQSGCYLPWLPEKLPLSGNTTQKSSWMVRLFCFSSHQHHTCHGASYSWGASGHCTLCCESPSGSAELKALATAARTQVYADIALLNPVQNVLIWPGCFAIA